MARIRTRRFTRAFAAGMVFVCASLSACDHPTAPRAPSTLGAIGGASVTGVVGTTIAGPFAVHVFDDRGRVIRGANVSCVVEAGGGTVAVASPVSSAAGTASCGAWTLGTHAGPQTLLVSVGSATPVRFTATAAPGAAAKLAFVSSLPSIVRNGVGIDPPLALQLRDAFDNDVATAGVSVTISVNNATVTGGSATTDASGKAVFTNLHIVGVAGVRTLTVSTTTAGLAVPAPIAFNLIDAMPASIEFGTANAKNVIVDPGQTVALPASVVRDAGSAIIPGTLVTYTVRSPAVASVSADGRVTGIEPGRTVVVASVASAPALIDSVVVHVTRSTAGPLILTDLNSLSLAIGVDVDVRVLFDTRTAGALSAVTVDVAYPRNSPSLLQLMSVTPAANATAVASETVGLVRLVYTNSTGATGLVELARLRFSVKSAIPSFSQLVLTPLQVITAALQDVTAITTPINPLFGAR